MYRIKINLKEIINSHTKIILDLGSGQKKREGMICIDKMDLPNVDIVANLEEGIPFFPDNSVNEIHATSFFEHIENFENLMKEIFRILKKGGKCYVFIPHFSNPYYFSDYTHKRFFGLYSFYYFSDRKHQLKRKVPNFYTDIRIKILSQRLIFTSPFKHRIFFKKKILERIFNINTKFQEFYEENLCYLLPCYGLEIVFTPIK